MPGRSEAILAGYVSRLSRGLDRAMDFLRDEVKQSLAVNYPPASSPGDPPHRRTGHLQQGVTSHHAEFKAGMLVGAVGVDLGTVPYARRLELGFVGTDSLGRRYNQAPRPYLRPGLRNNQERIRQMITG